MRNLLHYNFIFLLIFCNLLLSNQKKNSNLNTEAFGISNTKYSTNSDGEIMIYVNVLGEVNSPGRHLVYEGIDFATLLSQIGGQKNGANMSKVRVIRDLNENSSEIFIINLKKFIKYGDKSDFITLNPNDTIIFPESIFGFIFSRVNSLNTILNLFTIYLTLSQNFTE